MDDRVLVASWPPSLWIRLSQLPALPTPGPAELQTRPWPSASHIRHRQRVLPAPRRKGPGGRKTGRAARRASAWARRPVPGDSLPPPRARADLPPHQPRSRGRRPREHSVARKAVIRVRLAHDRPSRWQQRARKSAGKGPGFSGATGGAGSRPGRKTLPGLGGTGRAIQGSLGHPRSGPAPLGPQPSRAPTSLGV